MSIIPGFEKQENLRTELLIDDGYTYHIDPLYKNPRKKANKFISKMLPIMKKKLGFDAAMSGNNIYIDQQEFFILCEKNNIPPIILNKEGIGAKNMNPEGEWIEYGIRFIGAKMLFMNENHMKYELKNLKGLNQDKAELIGQARFDFYFHSKNKKSNNVVFFSFLIDEYVKSDVFVKNKKKLKEIEREFHKMVFDFARSNANYKVQIKTKTSDRYFKLPKILYQNIYRDNLPDNLIITNKNNVDDLILNANVVLGFNTTALVEALAAGKVVGCPDFSILGNGQPQPYGIFNKHEKLIQIISNYEIMCDVIKNYENYMLSSDSQLDDLLKPLVYKNDGKVSIRAEDAIIDSISASFSLS